MPKNINLTGTAGKSYNLDELNKNTRGSSDSELLVQIWQWCPDLPNTNERMREHQEPNPPAPKIGQIWLSKLIKKYEADEKTETAEYRALLESLGSEEE